MMTREQFDLAVKRNTVYGDYVSWDGVFDDLCERYPAIGEEYIAEFMIECRQEAA